MLRLLRVISLFLLAAILLPSPAQAKSVKDFEAMSTADQSEYVVSFLEKMTYDIRQANPALAQDIKNYFVVKQPNKPISEGIEKLNVELAALESLSKEGKADLAKIQLESVIVWVVKQKFPPPKKS